MIEDKMKAKLQEDPHNAEQMYDFDPGALQDTLQYIATNKDFDRLVTKSKKTSVFTGKAKITFLGIHQHLIDFVIAIL